MQRTIRVVLIEPGKNPEIREIENTLQAKQDLIGGYMEAHAAFPIGELNLVALVNEDGNGLEPNRVIAGNFFVGPILLITTEKDDPTEFGSFTEEEAMLVREMYRIPALDAFEGHEQ